MEVFISWSGERSREIANVLRDWLPNVIQAVKPWMSAADIDKGTRWSSDIAVQLEGAKVGIICLTPENLEAQWILFEAGALSKTLEKTYVCPYLFQVEPTDIKGPLVQFQHTKATKDDTRKLLHTINKALVDEALDDTKLDKSFDIWWPELDKNLKSITDVQTKREERSEREILEEILELVREQTREKKLYSLDISKMYNSKFHHKSWDILPKDPQKRKELVDELANIWGTQRKEIGKTDENLIESGDVEVVD